MGKKMTSEKEFYRDCEPSCFEWGNYMEIIDRAIRGSLKTEDISGEIIDIESTR